MDQETSFAQPFKKREIVFIQIGANEGVMKTDPLCSLILRDHWKGILIEPIPRVFEKLKKNYVGYHQLYFENVAISNTKKVCNFYVVDEDAEFFKIHTHLAVNEAGGLWGDLVGSLDRSHIFRCKPNLSDKEIKTLQVQCVTLQDILDKYQLDHLDIIHMDAEGHDATILLSINFEKIRPTIIIFEHVHMTFEVYVSCIGYLQSYGYSVIHTSKLDTVVSNI